MLYFNRVLFYSILFFFSLGMQAQKQWTLEECVRYAQDNNLGIKQSKLQEDNSQLDIDQAIHSRYPNLNGNLNSGINFGRTIDPTTNDFLTQSFLSNNIGINTGVILYDGNRINNTIKQSKINNQAASENTKNEAYELAIQVSSLFLNIVFAEENVRLIQLQKDLAQEQFDNLQKLIKAGVRPQNDKFELEALVAQRNQQLINAINNVSLSKLRLAQSMQLKDQTIEITYDDNVGITTDPDLLDYNLLLEKAVEANPLLRVSSLNLASRKIDEKLAKSTFYPTISVGGNIGSTSSNRALEFTGLESDIIEQTVYIDNNPVQIGFEQNTPIFSDKSYVNQFRDNISYGLGLGVNIPIYNNKRNKVSVEKAKIGIANQEIIHEQLFQQLELNLQQALLEAKNAKATYEASLIAVKAQEAAFENAEKKYKAGSINSFEYVNFNNQWQQAKNNTLIAKYDYLFKIKTIDFYIGKF